MKTVILKTVLPIGLMLAMTVPAVASSNLNDIATENQNAQISQVNTNILTNDDPSLINGAAKYLTEQGRITNIENNSIRVASDQSGDIIYNFNDTTLIYSLDSTERVEFSRFVIGQTVSVFYNALTPQAMSLPSQINPEVIVIHDNLLGASVKVDYFNEDSISSDGLLKLNAIDYSLIVDENNQMVRFDDALDKNLIVFYNLETTGISSQKPTVKIIVLTSSTTNNMNIPELPVQTDNNDEPTAQEPNETQIEDMVEVIISGLGNEVTTMIDNTRYVQVAPVATQLGFTVNWDPATALVTLTKGDEVITLTPGQTEYSHNRAVRYFDTVPFIQNDKTYVEYSIFTLMR